MRSFLIKVGSFFATLFIFFTIAFIFFSYRNWLSEDKIKLDKTKTTIVMGDSHVQNGFNDKLTSNHINLAKEAESYYLIYYKLKVFLDANPHIDTLYLGLNYHNFSNSYDEFIFGQHSASVSSNYFFILPFREQIRCLIWNKNRPLVYMRENMKSAFNNLLSQDELSYKGGYKNGYRGKSTDTMLIKKRIRNQFYKNSEIREFSKLNLLYLNKINALCYDKGVKTVILKTPLNENYRQHIPNIFIEKYAHIIADLGVPLIQFDSLNWPSENFAPDGDHLSVVGSEVFMDYFNKLDNRIN